VPSSFHNRTVGPSLRLHKTLEKIFSIASPTILPHPHKDGPKNMHLCMTNKDIQAIIQISIDPKLEIRDFLNELWNEWMILGKYEYFFQIFCDIIIFLSQLLQQISKSFVNIFMCVPNYKNPN
jgi:hypothetical protein